MRQYTTSRDMANPGGSCVACCQVCVFAFTAFLIVAERTALIYCFVYYLWVGHNYCYGHWAGLTALFLLPGWGPQLLSWLYVTASKMLLLCKGLQLVTAENQWTVTVQKVKELVAALCSAMDRKFLRMEYNTVLSETTLLDPRFKKLAFSDRRAVDEALQRISAAAAAKCTPSSQPAPPLQGQVEEEQQTSAVWRLFDDRATGDASRRNPTADAIMEVMGDYDIHWRGSV
ncbi:unnamed protein product [Coregonus sp. 'balchen']|nr:unnamed protein product [Coregonus sp. 'balchen']